MIKKIEIKTTKKRELIDITDQVEVFAERQSVSKAVSVNALHTTCAVIITENEDNLSDDLIKYLERDGPRGPFEHSHGDLKAHDPKHASDSHTPAHLLSAIIGQSRLVPLENGRLVLGTWQRICLLELDGPRQREVIVQSL